MREHGAKPPGPSPAKGDSGSAPAGQVSWLPDPRFPHRGTFLLSAPSRPYRSFPGSGYRADFVSGYSCGAAMESHHLPCARRVPTICPFIVMRGREPRQGAIRGTAGKGSGVAVRCAGTLARGGGAQADRDAT